MNLIFQKYYNKKTEIYPLVIFRIGFGLLMLVSIIRFWYLGWIEKLYLEPQFHFSYYGFEWVKPIGNYTYILFLLCGLSAFFVAIGFKYRIAIITLFLSFTYIELMDKTTYLNHYYAISLLSFLMMFLPANKYFSIDSLMAKKNYRLVPVWTIDSIKFMLCIVYFYAGLAKLNSDWLVNAMPLKIWLPSKFEIPLIGESLMQQNWFHHAMSWSGMLYDLSIPFLLLYKPTRKIAFLLVVFFHLFTGVLFPIGMFPYIMIVSALIFFEANFHNKIINFLKALFNKIIKVELKDIVPVEIYEVKKKKFVFSFLLIFFAIQLIFPFRYLAYPGELFWTEQGYRFSWRVMLIEKVGYATFEIVDPVKKQSFYVDNTEFLTPFQEKQMSMQPDFILEYAHFLGDHYKKKGIEDVQVFSEVYVALNGRQSKLFIDKNIDLYREKESFKNKSWILPLEDEIKGL